MIKQTSNLVLSAAFCAGMPLVIGCQTWSGFGFGNPSRVPPPATGTYQPPVGYYNNNSSVSGNAAAGGVVAPMATRTVAPMAAGVPASNLTAAALPDGFGMPPGLPGTQVQAASYTGVGAPPISTGDFIPSTGSLSDAVEVEQPSLKWQK